MQVTKESHANLKELPTTIPIHGMLGHKLQESLKASNSTVMLKRNLLIPDINPNIKVSGNHRKLSAMDSQSTTPRTKSHTPYKSSMVPSSCDRDRVPSFNGEGIIKEELQIVVPSETQENVGYESISPIRVTYSREAKTFEKLTEFDPVRDTELDNGDYSSIKLNSVQNQTDLMCTMDRKDDSTIFLNHNTSTLTATRIFVTNPHRGRHEYDLSEMDAVDKKSAREREASLDKSPEVSKVLHREEDMSNSRTKWSRLSLVMKSLMLFQRQEVKAIDRADAIQEEINNFKLRTSKDGVGRKKDLASEDFAKEAFDVIRRVSAFCECAQVGSPEHVELMRLIIDEDPKKFMYEPNDSSHLLNRKNNFGHTPLYIAAKNGNLEVVKLLVQKKADFELTSQIDKSTTVMETPLQAAVRWSHESVVEYMLKSCEYSKNAIQGCLKLASNKIVKGLLRKILKEKFGIRSLWSFCCCFNS